MKLHPIRRFITNPEWAVRFHAVWLLVWLIPGSLVTLLWLADSVAWVAWMSLYAIVIGHWSSMQAALAERRVERNEDSAAND